MPLPEAPQESSGNLLAAALGTGGGASAIGVAAILYESFKADKCAEILTAQQTSYTELLTKMMEHLAK